MNKATGTPPNPQEEIATMLAHSLLRDFFAAVAMNAIVQMPHAKGWDGNDVATEAYLHADGMMLFSKTPSLIEKLNKTK